MSDVGYAVRFVMGIAWQADRSQYLLLSGLGLGAQSGMFAFALGIRQLVDAVARDESGAAGTGAAICAAAILGYCVMQVLALSNLIQLQEKMTVVLDQRLMVLCGEPPGLEHFERAEYLDRLHRLQWDRYVTYMTVRLIPFGVGQALVQTLAGFVILAVVQPFMLVVLPIVGLGAVLNAKASAWVRDAENAADEDGRRARDLFDLAAMPAAAKEVRVFGLSETLVQRHSEASASVERMIAPARWRSWLLTTTSWALLATALAAGLTQTAHAAAQAELSPGDIALVLSMVIALILSSAELADTATLLGRLVRLTQRYRWLQEHGRSTQRLVSSPAAAPPAAMVDGIRLRAVDFAYPGGTTALTGVDLHFRAGSTVAIVGDNGAGKSSLVKLLCRMYSPNAGSIEVDGVDLQAIDITAWRARIAGAFQDFVRYELTVRENVAIGDLAAPPDDATVAAALASVGGEAIMAEAQLGLDTMLGSPGRGGVDLSGGQWQKLAVARAVVRAAPLLMVFDEPTAALDPQSEHHLFERVTKNARDGASIGQVTVLVSHRFSTVRMADHIVVLDGGRVAEQGSHDELMTGDGQYAQLYRLQARAYS